jgi:DNA processing protein
MNATAVDRSATGPESFLDHVRLACLPGVGSILRKRLLDHFGSPEAIFAATAGELRAVHMVGPKLADAIATLAGSRIAEETIDLCRRRGVAILPEGVAGYPRLLSQIDDPPPMLFVKGRLEPCDGLAVSIVGARHATAYGRRIAFQLAGGLARAGYTIVSGLARGIDAAAHRGALDAGGRTLAVLGSGVLSVYPPEHAELAVEVAGRGAVISEAPPLATPIPGAFPSRNRIVSGLSLGTLVVEAADRSGALITALLAGEQGREVFAVPGPIDGRMSRGSNRLIQDGAKLVTNVDDVLEELGPLFEPTPAADGREVRSPAELRLDEVERTVLAAFDRAVADAGDGQATVDVDDLLAGCELTVSRVLAAVGALEMRRIITRLPGNRLARI